MYFTFWWDGSEVYKSYHTVKTKFKVLYIQRHSKIKKNKKLTKENPSEVNEINKKNINTVKLVLKATFE